MKHYLIVGGSSGIGAALAAKLAPQANVYATGNVHPVAADGVTAIYLNVLDDEYDLSALPEQLDGLVYCPGSIALKPLGRVTEAELLQDYRLNVTGAIRVLQAVLPRLKRTENASVVFFSTVAVQTGFPYHTLLSASKGAIEGLTRSLSAELAPAIRVNCIAPSITNTPLAEPLLNSEAKIQANAQRHPLKRVGSAEEIAALAAFLLSDDAGWITGQIMHVDGGMSAVR